MSAAVDTEKKYDTKDGKRLYAIAYEYRVRRGKWVPEIDYLHATDDGDARLQFFQSESPAIMRETRIVGIAPVIGHYVHDNHGEAVSV